MTLLLILVLGVLGLSCSGGIGGRSQVLHTSSKDNPAPNPFVEATDG